MTLVAPLALALGALAIPVVVLYMLRSRRARTPVPSTMLWDIGERNVHANAPWQPLRFSVLLLLQLLALALLIVAVARPARPTPLPLAEHTVLILDTSASMQALEGDGTRLDAAKAKALEAIAQLGPGQRMSVIAAGPQARVVLSGSSDRRALSEIVAGLRASDGSSDAAGAFALGASLETADVPTILHLYSDGGIPPQAASPVGLVHVPIGARAGNLAVARVALSPRGGGWDAFVHVSNTGTEAADATLELLADDVPLLREPIRLEPGAARDATLSLPGVSATGLVARLTNVRPAGGTTTEAARVNALAADDEARATFGTSEALRVLLVTPGNVFLEALLRSIPGTEVTTTAQPVPARGQTVAIYDRVAPPAPLEVPSLVIAAPGGARGVTVTGRLDHPVLTFVQPREPILAQVDLSRVAIRAAQRVRADEMRAIVAATDHPLLSLGVPGGTRLAYLSFDLRESNLPVQVAFPLLFGNLVTWLSRGDAPDRGTLVAGDPLPLRLPGGADRLEVTAPDGTRIERPTARALFDETDDAGFYRVRYRAGAEVVGEETLAVNVPAAEGDLEPRAVAGGGERGGSGIELAGLRTFGVSILALALAILMAEWWVAHGRPLPRRRIGKVA